MAFVFIAPFLRGFFIIRRAMYKTIELTQGQFAIVDDEDYKGLNKYKWRAQYIKSTGSFYAVRTDCSEKKQEKIYMHRQIMNTPKGMHTDHKSHNTLNNRKHNLRVCTSSQNFMNSKTYFNNHSGITGVSWHKRDKRWQAMITINKKQIHLGYFKNKQEAIKVRKKAETKYFGEFASNN